MRDARNYAPGELPRACRCCCETYTVETWVALAFVGDMVDDFEALELRNCLCGTTLAVALKREWGGGVKLWAIREVAMAGKRWRCWSFLRLFRCSPWLTERGERPASWISQALDVAYADSVQALKLWPAPKPRSAKHTGEYR